MWTKKSTTKPSEKGSTRGVHQKVGPSAALTMTIKTTQPLSSLMTLGRAVSPAVQGGISWGIEQHQTERTTKSGKKSERTITKLTIETTGFRLNRSLNLLRAYLQAISTDLDGENFQIRIYYTYLPEFSSQHSTPPEHKFLLLRSDTLAGIEDSLSQIESVQYHLALRASMMYQSSLLSLKAILTEQRLRWRVSKQLRYLARHQEGSSNNSENGPMRIPEHWWPVLIMTMLGAACLLLLMVSLRSSMLDHRLGTRTTENYTKIKESKPLERSYHG